MKKLIDFEPLQINCKQKFYRYSSGSLNSGEKVCKLQNNGLYHEKCNKEHCPIWNGLPDAQDSEKVKCPTCDGTKELFGTGYPCGACDDDGMVDKKLIKKRGENE